MRHLSGLLGIWMAFSVMIQYKVPASGREEFVSKSPQEAMAWGELLHLQHFTSGKVAIGHPRCQNQSNTSVYLEIEIIKEPAFGNIHE